ncbi:MAG: peptide-methionine (S)-S-oxide reductase MsrA [Betaproteobacteria bacterium]|jgi:peptide-methionine (S)-S-oxide reductase|nr:peptide-methionine (S)-S-oxide reductase MsrA [Betaproteobacteria bacterium]
MNSSDTQATAILGGGCFWCLEAVYDSLAGVISVESGYAGGHLDRPSYEDICGGDTGHAEVVRITYDPQVLSYADLLEVFFAIHDPTTLNAQGNDIGTQYRSVIFHHDAEQKAAAEGAIRRLTEARVFPRPIVTEVTAAPEFFPAEDYHQEYFERNPRQPYCQYVVAPKVAKFRQKFATRLKG